ncbi:conserved Plasmodium protein, unknown function [Plasmodium sp. gorilla clade G2]|uniref:conserved Plasmodium protein, unknown function n=1 Tax=Plasmodium sp. gorilla clade G2 TaxID=880535 RepID=UPI000D217269|nr:conserved Plasmodium protein, unknown function [Plasmodium sp. gorilla clade G2]SOV12979.1 conserved Plasmodium protein, unknown function [Plasmodium sp. gorilla clade G2]
MIKLNKKLLLYILKLNNHVVISKCEKKKDKLLFLLHFNKWRGASYNYTTKLKCVNSDKLLNMINNNDNVEKKKTSNVMEKDFLKINDFYYFNIYLMKDQEFVNFVLKYNFYENKNIYVSILIHLSYIYKNISIDQILKVLEKVYEQNKSSFSHSLIKGEHICKMYSYICDNIIKLNNIQLITFLKCCSYTINDYPLEIIKMINKFLISKSLYKLNINILHDICNSSIKIKKDCTLKKLTYDESIVLMNNKIVNYLKNQILNMNNINSFFQNVPVYINMIKEEENNIPLNLNNYLNKPETIQSDININNNDNDNIIRQNMDDTYHRDNNLTYINKIEGDNIKQTNHIIHKNNIQNIDHQNNNIHINENKNNNVLSQKLMNPIYDNIKKYEDFSSYNNTKDIDLKNFKNNCKLIFLNKINEINTNNAIASVCILKWLEIKDIFIYTHICEIVLKNIIHFDTKHFIRFLRKCHALKFEKNRNDQKENIKYNIDYNEYHGVTNLFNTNLENMKDIQNVENINNINNVNNVNNVNPFSNNQIDKSDYNKNIQMNEKNNVEYIEGSNLFLQLLNERVYQLNIKELRSITYGLYGFVENMKQFSHLNNLKNNMNLFFSMCVQYITNYIDKEILKEKNYLQSDNTNNETLSNHMVDMEETIINDNNMKDDICIRNDKNYDINMNKDYIYISPSKDIYIDKYDTTYNHKHNEKIKYICDILLNISYFNISKNHRKIKFVYEYINKLISNKIEDLDINNLLDILMSLSNLYIKTNDNYIFHTYKKIIEILQNEKHNHKILINGHHFNKLSIGILPILNEENKIISTFSQYLLFFVQNNIVPLRSCVFLLQNIMKNINIKLNESLCLLKLAMINRIYIFLKHTHDYIQTKNQQDNNDLKEIDIQKFLLIHSINENTLICIITSLSLILQYSKYGSTIKNDATNLILKIIPYVSKTSFKKFPKKHIHSDLIDILSIQHDDVKQVLISKM